MPVAGKLFKLPKPLDLKAVSEKLDNYRQEETVDEQTLITQCVAPIGEDTTTLVGVWSYDRIINIETRRGYVTIPQVIHARFLFFTDDKQYLLILSNKSVANTVALKLAETLNEDIREARLTPRAIETLIKETSKQTKIAFFQNMDLIHMEKGAIYGGKDGDVYQTDLWGEFIESGSPWYVMAKDKKTDLTVGIVGDGSITIFNSIEFKDFVDYVREEIVPMTN